MSSRKDQVVFFSLAAVIVALFGWHGWHHFGFFNNIAKARSCDGVEGQVWQVEITDSQFIPSNIQANLCDQLLIINRDTNLHEPAAGPHPSHHDYPEFDSKKPLRHGEAFELLLNRPGRFMFHDHLSPSIIGELIVREE